MKTIKHNYELTGAGDMKPLVAIAKAHANQCET